MTRGRDVNMCEPDGAYHADDCEYMYGTPCRRVYTTEYVLCAAIWVDTGLAEPPRRSFQYPPTGLVFTGWRHGDCFTTLNAWADLLPATERQRIGDRQIAGEHQGFLTSKGRFVNREEAMLIARYAEQTTSTRVQLYSEDLY